jgi:L-threonylcarbamoyladenylate synthase
VVAYPTESFYGLAVDVHRTWAIERLFLIKKRKRNRPILLLIPTSAWLEQYVAEVPTVARGLIDAFWPGGLTLVLKARADISPLITAGTGKIGVRVSSHRVAAALTKAFGGAISGTSANLSGSAPSHNAEEIRRNLGKKVDLILDGGECPGKTGSTVLDVTVWPPRILREGMVSADQLREVLI